MATPSVLYCTDEDISIRAPGDFAVLCPKDWALARGTDGVFSAIDLWTLTSASNNFLALGVAVGNIVQVKKPGVFEGTELFGVSAVTAGAVTLKRRGLAVGLGLPPSPAGGTTGVTFTVLTMAPQIQRCTFELNNQFGIDDLVQGRRSSDLYDPDEVREATAMRVLWQLYESQSRTAGESSDHFSAQAKRFKADYEDLIRRCEIHWKPTVSGSTPPTANLFGMRLARA